MGCWTNPSSPDTPLLAPDVGALAGRRRDDDMTDGGADVGPSTEDGAAGGLPAARRPRFARLYTCDPTKAPWTDRIVQTDEAVH